MISTEKWAYPGGNGPLLTAGTLGVTLLVGCLVAAVPEAGTDVEFLSGPIEGLQSTAAPGAAVRTGVSEPEWPSLLSAVTEPLMEDAEKVFFLMGEKRHQWELLTDLQPRTITVKETFQRLFHNVVIYINQNTKLFQACQQASNDSISDMW